MRPFSLIPSPLNSCNFAAPHHPMQPKLSAVPFRRAESKALLAFGSKSGAFCLLAQSLAFSQLRSASVRSQKFQKFSWVGIILALVFSVFYSMQATAQDTQPTAQATFAGGCFWCMEPAFANLAGVTKVTVGYTGGRTINPTYEQVSSGTTGHVEAIQVSYTPEKVPYQALLDIFWKNVDPTDAQGQFCDKGEQYRAGIFTHSPEQATLAEASKQKIAAQFAPKPVGTFIQAASVFYAAEDYHQAFYIKNPNRYKQYSKGCGREERLEELQGR